MLTKIVTAVLLTGALVVAGDAAYQKIGCCFHGSECCDPASECCLNSANPTSTGNCCSTQETPSCCSSVSRSALAKKSCCSEANPAPCCDAAFTYCTRTGLIYEGCCCEVVNGQYHCLITGIVSDECCCVPID